MPDFLFMAIRAISSFIFLLVFARILGKRHIAQLTFFDYVVGITIGNIASSLSCERDVNTIDGLIGLLVWGITPICISKINLKSYTFRNLSDGHPTVLIESGKILEHNLRKQKLAIDDLLSMLREKDVFKLQDIEFAVLETNGRISIMKKSEYQPVTPSLLNLQTQRELPPRIVIMDGHIMERTLGTMGYSKEWLLAQIQKQGANRSEDVFVAQLEANGKLYVALKQNS
ncbi:DUF421 domain-containing protein [Fodinisporobacter ferrooxydans]|uniref:DUF421 domain-containing protein n=1 Tax=Fodinisporobacter ferrooxydans TaxID=2901836 RepID=A0ABY4CNG9_9BACL|nr:DUF421 domain-containing protein [Alicyclobacillaceae bacterium MYW30-H2]